MRRARGATSRSFERVGWEGWGDGAVGRWVGLLVRYIFANFLLFTLPLLCASLLAALAPTCKGAAAAASEPQTLNSPPPLETQARCRRRARTPAHPCRTASQPVSRLPAASRQARASLSKRCQRAERDPSPEGTRTWPSAGRRARRTPGRSALARPSTSGRALATLLLARRCAALSKPRPVWPASAADWPRLVGARGSLPEA